MTRLDEFDKEECRSIIRHACQLDGKPPVSDEEFDRVWDEYLAEREQKIRLQSVN